MDASVFISFSYNPYNAMLGWKKKKEDNEVRKVKVHVLKNGIYADPEEIWNHPKTQEQLEKVNALVARLRSKGGK